MLDEATAFSAQHAYFAAKIAAAEEAAAAGDKALAQADRAFADVFRGYFSVEPARRRVRRQDLSRQQLISSSHSFDAWWVFGDEPVDLAVGFTSRLVAAAADFAIVQRFEPPSDQPPTPIDRSIAAAFARRFTHIGADADHATLAQAEGGDLEKLLPPDGAERWRLLAFSGALPSDAGEFAVIIARADRSGAPATATHALLTDENIAKVRKVAVTALCFGGFAQASLGRVLALKPGDVLPIEWRGAGEAPLMLGGRTFATGTLGDHKGKRAIRL